MRTLAAGSMRSLRQVAIALASLCALAASPALAQSIQCTITSSPPSDQNHPVAPGTMVTLTLNCTPNATTYSWSNGATTQSITVTAAAGSGMQYFFTATNSAGAYTASYVINVTGGGSSSPVDTRVSGSATGNHGSGQFVCFGMPTCIGSITVLDQHPGCSNNFTFTSGFTLTGLDLSHPGSFSGTATLDNAEQGTSMNGNGTCTYSTGPGDGTPYSGTWDGKNGSFVVHDTDDTGNPQPITGTFTASLPASSPPVFPMTVNGSYTPTTTDVGATVQAPPQVVGQNASLFVFAHAPSNLVIGASPVKRVASSPPASAVTKSDAIVCVLAQVNSSGQFVAVSASSMQAYLTGVLTSQSQAVEILNNVQTSNVAGATMYVGYGSSASAMLSSGVYQTAISVPGGVQCTASLASAPAPTLPGAITGLWWNANESGWGIHFTQRGANVFAAWYTYDAAGNPKWYVAPQCAGMTGTSGTCTGSLYEVNGPTFFGVNFVPITSNQVTAAGTISLTFTDANTGSMKYTVGTVTRTVPITRQPVGVGTLTPAVDYSDLWYNASESGWGMAMAQQNANIFLAWYVYDNTGKPVWYVASNCTVSGSSCSGALYGTKGPPFGPTFPPNQIQVATAGSVIVSFIDANNAVLSYTVGNVTTFKTITRQLF
ncbi:MAG: hypothetical protein WA190_08545 [Usitatibacter sp.]